MRQIRGIFLGLICVLLVNSPSFTKDCKKSDNFDISFENSTFDLYNISTSSLSQSDLDNDSIADLIVTDKHQGFTTVLKGQAKGTFTTPSPFKSIKATYSTASDLNNDGWNDLVLLNRNENTLEVILNNKEGSFQDSYLFHTGEAPNHLTVADFNNDGKNDLLISNTNEKTLTLFIGNEKSVLVKSREMNLPGKPYYLTHGDFNKDNKLDVAVSLSDGDKISILSNDGNGVFSPYKTIIVNQRPGRLKAGDLNSDEKIDLVIANKDSKNVAVLLGSDFSQPVYYEVAGKPEDIVLANLNGDCDLDIVTANSESNNISILRGNSEGTFEPSIEFSASENIVAIEKTDLNKDDNDDLVLATDSSVSLLIQKAKQERFLSLLNNDETTPDQIEANAEKENIPLHEDTIDELSNKDEPRYVEDSILVKLKEDVDPNSVILQVLSNTQGVKERVAAAANIKFEMLHAIDPVVAEEKRKLEKTWKQTEKKKKQLEVNGKFYSRVSDVSDAELFKHAYKRMLEQEKSTYRSHVLRFPQNIDVEATISALMKNENIEAVEPDWIFKVQVIQEDELNEEEKNINPLMLLATNLVNDPLYKYQYGLQTTNSDKAWDISEGEGVVIAVIDTGVDYNHEDIAENIWVNPNEIPDNGKDDDGNGFVDDVRGYDFLNNDNDPMDDHGHGTHVSGIIAAVKNNNKGIAGVAPKAKILPIKGLSKNGSGSTSTIAKAVYYAADIGAQIINNSWVGLDKSIQLEDALNYSKNRGTISIVAAGNSSRNILKSFPAVLDSVIAVAATDPDDKKAYFSNWGSKVAVAAPGYNIVSLRAKNTKMGTPFPNKTSRYIRASGTSFSCPHVSGLIALILSKNKGYEFSKVKSIIQATTKKPNPGQNHDKFRYIGTGIIQTDIALKSKEVPVLISLLNKPEILKENFIANKKSPLEIYGEVKGGSYSISYSTDYPYSNDWTEIFKSEERDIDRKGLLANIDPTSFEDNKLIFIKLTVQKNGFKTYAVTKGRFNSGSSSK